MKTGPVPLPGCGRCGLCTRVPPDDFGARESIEWAVRLLIDEVTGSGKKVRPWAGEGDYVILADGDVTSGSVNKAPERSAWAGEKLTWELADALTRGRATCVEDDFNDLPWVAGLPLTADTSRILPQRLGLLALVREGKHPGNGILKVRALGGWAPGVTSKLQAQLVSKLVLNSGGVDTWAELVPLAEVAAGILHARPEDGGRGTSSV